MRVKVPSQPKVTFSSIPDHYTPEEKQALIKELEIMKMIQPHPNIVSLLGCCTQTGQTVPLTVEIVAGHTGS